MSLATRCTHCGTIFKVVQDQLKVSEGWVRCGRCQEVFNALPALFDLEKDPPPPRPAHLGGPQEAPAQAAPDQLEQPPRDGSATPPQEAAQAFPQEPSQALPQGADRPDEAVAGLEVVPAAVPETAPSDFPSQAAQGRGVAIPLTAMSNIRQQPDAPTEATRPAARDALIEQGLIADADVDLGFDSQPPSGWARTQPTGIAQHMLDEEDLALEPPPVEATTDFELDTSIAVDDNTPLEAVLASVAPRRPAPAPTPSPSNMAPPAAYRPPAHDDLPLRAAPEPRIWQDDAPDSVPSTEEEDALDSRYLMPSPSRERKTPHRLEEGPEFADAQFPSDAFIDAEEDWASDFGPSALEADAAGPAATSAPDASSTKSRAKAAAAAADLRHASPPDDAASEDEAPPDSDGLHDEATPDDAGETPTKKKRKRRGKRGGADEPEFLKHAQRKAFWRHPAMRATLSLLLLGLLAGLGLQLAHQFRDLIAAYHPASRPLLAQWCAIAQCDIKPPLRIEDLQVESATLVRASSDGPDSYRLAVVVHNKSTIGLAWPHIDLTLTDDNGAVIARRVFSPGDAQWLDTADAKAEAAATPVQTDVPAAGTPPAAPGQRSTTLQWRLLAPDIKPAGYTAELFYP